ncbi:hypothetical protein Taro_048427 [Colocasia esculenta]|uniref:very-long-chain 3-oxoacyl-CoA synthase n=1 Tax=Colocasia esculenta TaxID=4460 RepID=A0A843WVT5_COLES|nr:hypothetical protein [Colocasia esculenta]
MASAAGLLSAARWWLVEHPVVASFEWDERRTWGASPRFPAAVVAAYLSLTFLLRGLLFTPQLGPPATLRRVLWVVSPIHSGFLLLLSLVMATGCCLAAAAQMPSPSWIFCFPRGTIQPRGPVFFWAYVFYLSKVYELVDTLLILLAADRRRLSFLHVYHHAVVVGLCYLWLSARQSLLPVGLVTNASVHVIMYAYYLCSSVGLRWPPQWKRAVTNCQIVQFWFSFAVSLVFLWLHFFGTGGKGCSGSREWLLNAAFNASLLTLFQNFHKANYSSSRSFSAKATKAQ